MYLKCKWIQLFLLLCSLPLPSSWWGTDSFRTARVRCSHSGTNIALLWPQEAESLSHKSPPRHSSVARCLWLGASPAPSLARTRLRLGPGGRGSSFCLCPVTALSQPSLLKSRGLPAILCFRVSVQESPPPGARFSHQLHLAWDLSLSHGTSAQGGADWASFNLCWKAYSTLVPLLSPPFTRSPRHYWPW